MNKKNVISLVEFKELKTAEENNRKYEALLDSLSLTEIRSEINGLLNDLRSMIGLGKKEADQGKMILKQLEERCTEAECSAQINMMLSHFEKQFSTLDR